MSSIRLKTNIKVNNLTTTFSSHYLKVNILIVDFVIFIILLRLLKINLNIYNVIHESIGLCLERISRVKEDRP